MQALSFFVSLNVGKLPLVPDTNDTYLCKSCAHKETLEYSQGMCFSLCRAVVSKKP